MSNKNKIEWTDASWDTARGCTKISPGCKNCYAAEFAERFREVENLSTLEIGHGFKKAVR
jgi:protein gp37